MKCIDLHNILDDFIDEIVSSAEKVAAESHLEQCASCRKELEQRRSIQAALHSLPVADASAEFETKVFSAVQRQYGEAGKQPDYRFFAGFASAAVAGLALWFVSTLFTPSVDEYGQGSQLPQVVNLAVNQVRTVKLAFDSATELTDVTLTVELPENIRLEGFGEQKQLVWQTNLNRGQNILALPVIATGNGRGQLLAQLRYGDKTRQIYILLEAADEGALILQKIDTLSV